MASPARYQAAYSDALDSFVNNQNTYYSSYNVYPQQAAMGSAQKVYGQPGSFSGRTSIQPPGGYSSISLGDGSGYGLDRAKSYASPGWNGGNAAVPYGGYGASSSFTAPDNADLSSQLSIPQQTLRRPPSAGRRAFSQVSPPSYSSNGPSSSMPSSNYLDSYSSYSSYSNPYSGNSFASAGQPSFSGPNPSYPSYSNYGAAAQPAYGSANSGYQNYPSYDNYGSNPAAAEAPGSFSAYSGGSQYRPPSYQPSYGGYSAVRNSGQGSFIGGANGYPSSNGNYSSSNGNYSSSNSTYGAHQPSYGAAPYGPYSPGKQPPAMAPSIPAPFISGQKGQFGGKVIVQPPGGRTSINLFG